MWGRRELLATAAFAPLRLLKGDNVSYTAEVEQWRREREKRLLADDGWTTLVGLHWLSQGTNRVEGLEFILDKSTARVRIPKGVTAKVNNKTVTDSVLKVDQPGPADLVTLGTKTMFVIVRSGRYGIRVRDTGSPYRKGFKGLQWYSVKPAYLIEGKLEPSEKSISIPTVLGTTEQQKSPGVVRFSVGGAKASLRPVLEGDRLFFIFRDLTTGKGTYPAGRFLYSDMPKPGAPVVLDFNKAYTPPCAFTPYATCPLPPPENRLKVAIEAGELNYHHD